MNETVVSFCGCLKSSTVKLNINNSRANAIFISTGLFNTLENPAKENI
ncbi:MAG: hypothetical protein CM15mP67_00360 [Alphaproteobacteria bacterium]|nr:MAG: hypothetical protein CM15mP67_00360 [Alphaproteobacteria bacterium]